MVLIVVDFFADIFNDISFITHNLLHMKWYGEITVNVESAFVWDNISLLPENVSVEIFWGT
jgi:hypothetical protein